MSKSKSTVEEVQIKGVRFTLLYRWHGLRPNFLAKKLGVSVGTLGAWEERGRFLWPEQLASVAESFGCTLPWLLGHCSEELQVAYRTLRTFWLNRSAGFDATADKLLKLDPPGSPEDFEQVRKRWGLLE